MAYYPPERTVIAHQERAGHGYCLRCGHEIGKTPGGDWVHIDIETESVFCPHQPRAPKRFVTTIEVNVAAPGRMPPSFGEMTHRCSAETQETK